MYSPEQKQYILKNSLGVSYHVYFEQGRGLCIRMLSDSRIWSRGYVLDKSAINDFSVALDKNDIFHFFFQTQDGSLMYGHGMHGQIECRPILNSKDHISWPKHVSLLVLEKAAIFFYVITYQNRYLVSMQSVQDGKLSKPVAIAYIENASYLSFLDREGKCHLLYVSSDKTRTHLYHRVLKDDLSTFNLPEKIFSTDYAISSISAVCTETNNIHIAFEVSGDEFYEVMYRNLSAGEKSETLYTGKTAPGYSGLVYNSGIIIFFRVADGNIYFKTSENNGVAWTDESLYPFGSNIACFSFSSNHSNDKTIFSMEIPGNFTRGYQLAFLNGEKIKPAQDRKTSNNRENDYINNLEKKIILLQNLTDNMQRELTKLWLTQKSFEKRLEQLLRSFAGVQQQPQCQPSDEYNEETPPEPDAETPENVQTGDTNSEKV